MVSALRQDIPRAFLLAYLLSMPIYCMARLAGQPDWIGLSTALTAASLFAFSLTYAIVQHGPRCATAMLMVSFGIALTLEYLGSSYGILFGEYEYTDRLGPKLLGKVPAIIPIAWFMMLYPSWATAGYLLMRSRPTAMPMPAVRVGIAASAMTAWDLSLDPRMVADGNWVWQVWGPYFGIPLSNYLGWFVTAALIYIVWHVIARPEQNSNEAGSPTKASSLLGFRYWPIWTYIVTWLGESAANAIFWGGPLVALAVFIGMGLFGGPALFSLWRSMRQMQPRLLARWPGA